MSFTLWRRYWRFVGVEKKKRLFTVHTRAHACAFPTFSRRLFVVSNLIKCTLSATKFYELLFTSKRGRQNVTFFFNALFPFIPLPRFCFSHSTGRLVYVYIARIDNINWIRNGRLSVDTQTFLRLRRDALC